MNLIKIRFIKKQSKQLVKTNYRGFHRQNNFVATKKYFE
jgi:hypothetical protein